MSDFEDEQAELLDDDVLPEEYPPEQPYGVGERLTPAEEQGGESVEDRRRRERPDRLGADEDRVGQLVAPDEETGPDEEADEVAFEVPPALRRDQRDPSDLTGMEGTDREEVIPAEEAAMH